eukprot:TRINITY_DN8717_c0_g1_i1.p1 TRINITY_DN8717_c0_g1~~TRINITY_DN8717_c0_g1_i1.p1  ORF type:complete len:488 (+),score=148.55 TRINITY_DN8717_c0_g1_i1:74-1537(+)
MSQLVDLAGLDEVMRELKCTVCRELYEDPVQLPCGHLYCRECIMDSLDNSKRCPLCRAPARRLQCYPVLAIQDVIAKLRQLGSECGVADIAATQFSQLVVRTFDPKEAAMRLRRQQQQQQQQQLAAAAAAAAAPAAPVDLVSQLMRSSKSQAAAGGGGSDADSQSSAADSAPPGRAAAPAAAAAPPPPAAPPAPETGGDRAAQCKNGHPLSLRVASSWTCDRKLGEQCEDDPDAEEPRPQWTCSQAGCDYDVCVRCLPPEPDGCSASRCWLCGLKLAYAEAGRETQRAMGKIQDRRAELQRASRDLPAAKRDALLRQSERMAPASAAALRRSLGDIRGPFTVTWRRGSVRDGVKLNLGLREDVRAHDLCLVWAHGTRIEDEQFTGHSVGVALRRARGRYCQLCGRHGAGMVCAAAGCEAAFCTCCGLFTGGIVVGAAQDRSKGAPKVLRGRCMEHARAAPEKRPRVQAAAAAGTPSGKRATKAREGK